MKYVIDTDSLLTLLKHHGILVEIDDAGVAVQRVTVKPGSREYGRMNYTEDFARFWNAYPRQRGKAEAFRAWEQVSHVMTSPAAVIKQAAAFAEYCKREGTEKRYIPHPATWLRAYRWEDDYVNAKHPPMTDGKLRIYREMQKESEQYAVHPRWSEYRNKVMSGQVETGFKEFIGEND